MWRKIGFRDTGTKLLEDFFNIAGQHRLGSIFSRFIVPLVEFGKNRLVVGVGGQRFLLRVERMPFFIQFPQQVFFLHGGERDTAIRLVFKALCIRIVEFGVAPSVHVFRREIECEQL
ncbi:hypothetical protein SDC9_170461 [bioreactor metagenome]|uniref:Uncharacterized protein n=1 Tax=bioreactor metagenome TaxID=1076179 RepID=A0A645GAC4_9ZZZZ